MTKICEYCGNTSGKENQYGQCISCGGSLTITTPHPSNNLLEIARRSNGIYSTDELREMFHVYTGVSGSSYIVGEAGKECVMFT